MSAHAMRQGAAVLCALFAMASAAQVWADSCHVSTGALAFGAYDTASAAALDVMGSLDIHCSKKVHVELSLGVGNGVGASYSGGRKMTHTGGTNTLTYNLYANAARTQVWGDGTHGSVTLKINRDKNNFSQTIWARLPARQTTASPGSYQDTVVASIAY